MATHQRSRISDKCRSHGIVKCQTRRYQTGLLDLNKVESPIYADASYMCVTLNEEVALLSHEVLQATYAYIIMRRAVASGTSFPQTALVPIQGF